MYLQQEPIPGYWYTNIVGQLVQVRAVLHVEGRVKRVVLEYANARRESVDMEGWLRLDLLLHSPFTQARDSVKDL